MCQDDDQDQGEATEDQLIELRGLGARERDLDDLSFEEAQEWIASLRAERQDAGKLNRG